MECKGPPKSADPRLSHMVAITAASGLRRLHLPAEQVGLQVAVAVNALSTVAKIVHAIAAVYS